MADDLTALEDWLSPLIAALSPQQRRGLARKVGQGLRRSQAARIAAQRAPDGSAYTPRKPQPLRKEPGRIRGAMFAKLRLARNLKVLPDDVGVAVGFLARTGRIARVHQEGQEDKVAPDGPSIRYPARVLLGFTHEEREMLRDLVLNHLHP